MIVLLSYILPPLNHFSAKKEVKTNAFKNGVTLSVYVTIWRNRLYFGRELLSVILQLINRQRIKPNRLLLQSDYREDFCYHMITASCVLRPALRFLCLKTLPPFKVVGFTPKS